MALLDLQGLQAPTGDHGGHNGSTLTVLLCHSNKPSNVSLALCH